MFKKFPVKKNYDKKEGMLKKFPVLAKKFPANHPPPPTFFSGDGVWEKNFADLLIFRVISP